MARKPEPPRQPPKRPALTRPREEAEALIQQRIDIGHDLMGKRPTTWQEIGPFVPELRKWRDYNYDLLGGLFTTDDEAKKFHDAGRVLRAVSSEAEGIRLSIGTLPDQIVALESTKERLGLFDAPSSSLVGIEESNPFARGPLDTSKVFIVHGHDGEALQSVARFVERLGFEAVILSEQANKGASIIEKLQANANVGFAIVIITGDDVGAVRTATNKLVSRARQNVILELGFFIGYLGRDKVCPLYEDGVELPSDYHGVGFVPLDKGNAWKLSLAKEMKAARLPVDMNKAV